jgi:hypothetical protein
VCIYTISPPHYIATPDCMCSVEEYAVHCVIVPDKASAVLKHLSLFCEGLYKQLRGLHDNVNVDARNLSRLTYCATDYVLYCSFLRRLTGKVGRVWTN